MHSVKRFFDTPSTLYGCRKLLILYTSIRCTYLNFRFLAHARLTYCINILNSSKKPSQSLSKYFCDITVFFLNPIFYLKRSVSPYFLRFWSISEHFIHFFLFLFIYREIFETLIYAETGILDCFRQF